LAIIILHAITGVCTPACLLAASISVEAVTPPLVGMACKEQTTDNVAQSLFQSSSNLGVNPLEVKHIIRCSYGYKRCSTGECRNPSFQLGKVAGRAS